MLRRAESADAAVQYRQAVARIEVASGRAVGIRTIGGRSIGVRRALIADVAAPQRYGSLLPAEVVPTRVRDTPVVKVNYCLDGTVPGRSTNLRSAGRCTWAPTRTDSCAGWPI